MIHDSLAYLRTELEQGQTNVLQSIVEDVTTITRDINDLASNPTGHAAPQLVGESLFDNSLFMFCAGALIGFVIITVALNWIIAKLNRQQQKQYASD